MKDRTLVVKIVVTEWDAEHRPRTKRTDYHVCDGVTVEDEYGNNGRIVGRDMTMGFSGDKDSAVYKMSFPPCSTGVAYVMQNGKTVDVVDGITEQVADMLAD